MPVQIDITIFWTSECDQMSYYSLYRTEIEEILMNYYCDQALLFTFFHPEILKEWMWDVYCREPSEVFVEQIIY